MQKEIMEWYFVNLAEYLPLWITHLLILLQGGSLDLSGCTQLKRLPAAGLSIPGSLILSRTAITKLPERLSIGVDLIMLGCSKLEELSEGLSVGRDLDCGGCAALKKLPKKLSVGHDLSLIMCLNLQELPTEELHIVGEFNLKWCTALRRLPSVLSVGRLILWHCEALEDPPARLSVEKGLLIHHCYKLARWPAELFFGGCIYREGKDLPALPAQTEIEIGADA